MLENAMNDPAKLNQPNTKPPSADIAPENIPVTSVEPARSKPPENLDDEALKGVAGGGYKIEL
jgi:hypothetical protein